MVFSTRMTTGGSTSGESLMETVSCTWMITTGSSDVAAEAVLEGTGAYNTTSITPRIVRKAASFSRSAVKLVSVEG